MKKQFVFFMIGTIIIISLVGGFLFILVGGCSMYIHPKTETQITTDDLIKLENKCNLFINQKNHTSETYVVLEPQYNRCIVSLFYIVLSLGGEITKQSTNSYKIHFNNDVYHLDTLTNVMTVTGNSMNILENPNAIANPYTEQTSQYIKPIYIASENDYLVDSNTMRHFLYLLNHELDIDYNSSTVIVREIAKSQIKIIVDNIELPFDDNVRINNTEYYAEIPLFSILRKMNVGITNLPSNHFLLKKDDKLFILNTNNNTLIKKGEKVNAFSKLAGGKIWHYYKVDGNEYYISSQLATLLIYEFGYKISIDYDSSTIFVTIRDNQGTAD